VFKDSSTIIGGCRETLTFRPRRKRKNVVSDPFVSGKNDEATRLADRSDTAKVDAAIVVEKVAIRNENIVLEFTLRGGGYADGWQAGEA
jgi:hypothetical protein